MVCQSTTRCRCSALCDCRCSVCRCGDGERQLQELQAAHAALGKHNDSLRRSHEALQLHSDR